MVGRTSSSRSVPSGATRACRTERAASPSCACTTQALNALAILSIPWDEPLETAMYYLRIVSFDIFILGPKCDFETTHVVDLALFLAAPVVVRAQP